MVDKEKFREKEEVKQMQGVLTAIYEGVNQILANNPNQSVDGLLLLSSNYLFMGVTTARYYAIAVVG
jgi:hypothetical protein